jgi:two-component system NtrC family sensor kinase
LAVNFQADPDGLGLVRDVARALNRDFAPEENLRAVAEILRGRLGLRRATVWRRAPSGTSVMAVSSPADPGDDRAEALPSPVNGKIQVPLVHAGHQLGVLELESDDPSFPPAPDLLTVVADVVAPFLDAVLLSEDLAEEVATRAGEIQAQRRFTNLIIDSLPVGLYVVDRDYRIQVWNRKRETGGQGLRRDQVIGKQMFEVLTRQPADQLKAEFDRIFDTGEVSQRELDVVVAGEQRVYRTTKIPMRLDGEQISHVITIGEDVTERRASEQRILQSEKLAAVGQLAAGVMHEINNPLATIGACVAAIEPRLGDPADAGVREYLEIIDTEVQRCTRIVDQLLDFSRPRKEQTPRRPTGLNALVEQTLLLLKHHARFKRLTVDRGLAEGLPPVVVDGERLVQAFMAIMLNAADAMEKGGTLVVRTGRNPQRPDEVFAEFEDSGAGIASADLDKIFEPFYTTKPPGRGTGLGLTICYGIVEEQGGRIVVRSEPGLGSAFRVLLPVPPETAA